MVHAREKIGVPTHSNVVAGPIRNKVTLVSIAKWSFVHVCTCTARTSVLNYTHMLMVYRHIINLCACIAGFPVVHDMRHLNCWSGTRGMQSMHLRTGNLSLC